LNPCNRRTGRAFTLVEVLIAVTIVGIIMAVALPSYRAHLVKQSRSAAQSEMIELASMQEKIYLNSNAYSTNLAGNYTGVAAGGLGRTTSKTTDGKYDLALVGATANSYTLTATPVSGSSQASDGVITLNSNGTRTCDTALKWCSKGIW
jgi:type IV pilus assembly protein PilE